MRNKYLIEEFIKQEKIICGQWFTVVFNANTVPFAQDYIFIKTYDAIEDDTNYALCEKTDNGRLIECSYANLVRVLFEDGTIIDPEAKKGA